MSLDTLRHRRGILLCCCASIALVSPVLAQEAAGTRLSPVIRLPEITLEAAGADDDANSIVAQEMAVGGKVATSILDTPASVSVITRAEIERRDARTLEDVLQYSAGTISDYYGTDDRNDYFLIRGFQASTYRDGITLGSMRGIREEPLAYDRVEVIRGANSTLFGVADPGGSVNFVTKRPRAERIRDVSATVGSHQRRELGFDVGDVLTPDASLSWRLTGRVKDAAREYDFSRDDAGFLMGGLTWQPSDVTSVSLIADYLKRDATPNSGGYPRGGDFDRSQFFGEPDFNYLNVERSTATLIAEHDFGAGLTLRANLRYSDTADDFGYFYVTGDVGAEPLLREVFGRDGASEEVAANVILQYDRQMGRVDSSTIAGIELRDVDATNRGFYASMRTAPGNPVFDGTPTADELAAITFQNERRQTGTRAVFMQQNLSLDDRFIATIGARRDLIDLDVTDNGSGATTSDDFAETSVRGALTWKITDEVSTYVSYAESVAPPQEIGRLLERGDQYEVGVKYQPVGTTALLSAAIYDLRKENNVVVNPSTFERARIGKLRVRGLDLEAKAELASGLDLTASYSYADSEILDQGELNPGVVGNERAFVPEHSASLWLNYRLPGSETRGDMTFGLGARYTGSYFFADTNDTGKSEATVLLDAAYSYDITESAQLSLNIHNLTDEKHVVGRGSADYYNPGREIALTLRGRF